MWHHLPMEWNGLVLYAVFLEMFLLQAQGDYEQIQRRKYVDFNSV
jgi:hypothetical protein